MTSQSSNMYTMQKCNLMYAASVSTHVNMNQQQGRVITSELATVHQITNNKIT